LAQEIAALPTTRVPSVARNDEKWSFLNNLLVLPPEPPAAAGSRTVLSSFSAAFDTEFLSWLAVCVDLAIPRDFADVFGHTDGEKLADIHDLFARQ